MNSLELIDSLGRYSVFDLATFASIAGLEHNSAKVRLFRMKERGYIFEVQRNAYTVHKDPFIVASRITWPSYISLWYALSYHGLTLQIPHQVSVMTTRAKSRSSIEFMGVDISFYNIKPDFFFGFERVLRNDMDIFIARPEKAIVDSVLFRKISISEIYDVIRENKDNLDLRLLVDYIIRCENGSLSKRIGYLLDKLGHDFHRELANNIYSTVIAFDYALPDRGEINRKWGVLDNTEMTA